MKVIKLKLDKEAYLDYYVGATLSLFFSLTKNESSVISRILYYINEEIADDIPLRAAVRLVSMSEYRRKIQEEIKVNNRDGDKVSISDSSFSQLLSNLKSKGLLNDKFEINETYIIKYLDNGFRVEIEIKEDD
jgi:hypothetical protein